MWKRWFAATPAIFQFLFNEDDAYILQWISFNNLPSCCTNIKGRVDRIILSNMPVSCTLAVTHAERKRQSHKFYSGGYRWGLGGQCSPYPKRESGSIVSANYCNLTLKPVYFNTFGQLKIILSFTLYHNMHKGLSVSNYSKHVAGGIPPTAILNSRRKSGNVRNLTCWFSWELLKLLPTDVRF